MAARVDVVSALADARSRRNIKYYNALMSKFARFGQLDAVEHAFRDIRNGGLVPNEYSYSIYLNTCTRSGAMDQCETILQEMHNDGIPVNEVHYTTLIKGHVSSTLGMAKAWEYFERMESESPRIAPNIRTVNTMLRGCLYVGDLRGTKRLGRYIQKQGLLPDRATRDTLVRAACTSFKAKKLKRALSEHVPDGVGGLSVAAQVDLCVAYALCGKYKRAAKVLDLVHQQDRQRGDPHGDGDRSGIARDGDGDGDHSGGGAAAGALATSVGSVRAFLQHPKPQRDAAVTRFRLDHVRRYPPVLSEASASASSPDGRTAAAQLEMASLFDEPSRPVKLEVGAGLGDWVILRAEAEPTVNWLAIELRCDRACLIHAKAAMRGVTNLAVLAGDAHGIMASALPSNAVAEVHVNFPQPPQWYRSEAHLVNRTFLDEAWRILCRGGAFVMTSDCEPYVEAVTQRLASDAEGLASKWQPSFGAPPHYKTHDAKDLRGHESVFNQLWAARGFTRRFQCKYYTKRLRNGGGSTPAVGTAVATDEANVECPGGIMNAAAGMKKKRKHKETSSQRRKRARAKASAAAAV